MPRNTSTFATVKFGIAKSLIASAFAAVLLALAGASSSQAAPVYPMDLARNLPAAAEAASFWGRPYPYGYAYRGGYARGHSCIRYKRVMTPDGWRSQRVSVCRPISPRG